MNTLLRAPATLLGAKRSTSTFSGPLPSSSFPRENAAPARDEAAVLKALRYSMPVSLRLSIPILPATRTQMSSSQRDTKLRRRRKGCKGSKGCSPKSNP